MGRLSTTECTYLPTSLYGRNPLPPPPHLVLVPHAAFTVLLLLQEIRIQCRIQSSEIQIRGSGLPRYQICCSLAVYRAFSEFRDQDCPETRSLVHLPCTVHSRRFSAQQAQRLPPVPSQCIRLCSLSQRSFIYWVQVLFAALCSAGDRGMH